MPPTRPGKNGSDGGATGEKISPESAKKSPENRQTGRSKGRNGAIQAEGNQSNPAVADGGEATSETGVLGENKQSKRRRRRRGRKRPSNNQTAQNNAENQTADISEKPSITSTKQSDEGESAGKSRNRRNRRRNRRKPQNLDGNASTAAKADQQSPSDHFRKPSQPQQNRSNDRAGKPHRDPENHQDRRRQGQNRGHSRPSQAYAALDLGTNNCRLLVAVPQQPGRFRVVDAFSRIVRLGEGLAATGRLSDDAMDRAVGALKACADKLHNREVKGVRLIATEACRRATNGVEFLKRVEEEAGLKLEIVDRETEARLAVAGCASLVDRKAKGVVLFDIGGGSSELALLDLRRRKKFDLARAMVSWTSLPMGVVTLSEKHGGGKHVTRSVFENMVNEVAEHLVQYEGRDALQQAAEQGEIHLLGTSGTVTTLAGIHLKLPRYDRRQVDGIWMASADVDQMIDQLVDMSFEQRVSNPCIGKDRADLVLAGCAILVAIQQLWPCQRLRVADRGLREGLLTEMMNADNAWIRRPKYFRNRRPANSASDRTK